MNRSFQREQEQKRRDERKRSMPWREYWHLYLSLIGTGILTAFAGIYLGLAPAANGDIVFLSSFDAVRRVFFALYYASSFLLVAEGATLFAKDKLLQRDVEEIDGKISDIRAQRNAMTFMLWISVLAIVATTVAAGYILAAWLRALDQFVTIPAVAQTWVVVAPPALLVIDAVCALIYQQNSKQSELDRWVQQQKRMAEANAEETFAREYVEQYNEVAPDAARRAARASAMTDARRWAGSGVDDREVSPRHDLGAAEKTYRDAQVMDKPKATESNAKWKPYETYKPGDQVDIAGLESFRSLPAGVKEMSPERLAAGPQPGDIVIEETHDPRMGAHVVPPEGEGHGVQAPAVTEEVPLPPESTPAAEPPTEVGTDQPSPT